MQLEAVEFEGTKRVTLVQSRVKLWAFVNSVMKFCAA